MTWREITAEQLNLLKQPLIIDVRSPCEHTQEYIPNSINIPLLSDDERAAVGTIYAQQGEAVARKEAVRIISPKISTVIDHIINLKKSGQPLVVHCWRGGMRSEAVASFLSLVGIDCFRLKGGYKAWRKEVLNDFEQDHYSFMSVVLHGLTGVGKTDVLQQLLKLGFAVLDLEQLANHRGSVFGGIGLGQQPTQKNFEAALWLVLKNIGDKPVFMEAESRKIGKLALPDFMLRRVQSGQAILVTGTISARVSRILHDYAANFDALSVDYVLDSLSILKERIGGERLKELTRLIMARNLERATEILLTEYYDPVYSHQMKKYHPYEIEVSGDNPVEAATKIAQWVNAEQSLYYERIAEVHT